MQSRHSFAILSMLSASLVIFVGASGCDQNEDVVSNDVAALLLQPSQAAINRWPQAEQQPLTLEIQGGAAPFTWSMSDDALGSLNNGNDSYARFALYSPTENAEGINIVRVRDSNGWEATSRIFQETFSITLAGAPPSTPNVLTLTQSNQQVQMTVAGGQLPLAWTISDPTLGTLSASGNRIAIYKRQGGTDGINTIHVADPRGLTATATLIQQGP